MAPPSSLLSPTNAPSLASGPPTSTTRYQVYYYLLLPNNFVIDGVCSNMLMDGCEHALQLFASALQAGRAKTEEEKAEALKQTFMAVETLEAAFKECSKGKPFFGGDSVGYLDIVLGSIVPWAYVGEVRFGIKLFDGTRSPLLEAWVERFAMMDAAKAVLPEVDKLIEYSKAKQARAAAVAAAARN